MLRLRDKEYLPGIRVLHLAARGVAAHVHIFARVGRTKNISRLIRHRLACGKTERARRTFRRSCRFRRCARDRLARARRWRNRGTSLMGRRPPLYRRRRCLRNRGAMFCAIRRGCGGCRCGGGLGRFIQLIVHQSDGRGDDVIRRHNRIVGKPAASEKQCAGQKKASGRSHRSCYTTSRIGSNSKRAVSLVAALSSLR
jgi:hypothetical protein